jgi:hypothetical protein
MDALGSDCSNGMARANLRIRMGSIKVNRAIPLLAIALLLLTPLSSPCAEAPKSKAAGKTASLTGCIDERNAGKYVLVDPVRLNPVAELEADGFANEGFAKHLGHKVVVKGREMENEGRTVLRVRSIEVMSETCEPGSASK